MFVLHEPLDLEGSIDRTDLSEGERNVLATVVLRGRATAMVKSGDAEKHPLAAGLPRQTNHRPLRVLMEKGIVDYTADHATRPGSMFVRDAIVSWLAAWDQAAV
jgi:hypothetical protein